MASSGNFATLLNGLLYQVGTNTTYSLGNTKYQSSSSGEYSQQASTIAPSSGKWYAEMYVNTVGNLNFLCLVGDIGVSDTTNRSAYPNRSTNGGMGYAHSGLVRFNNSDTSSGYSTYTDGDIIQIAFDIDNTKVWFGKNNTWQNSGDPANGTNASYTTWTTTYSTLPTNWHVAGNIGNTGANTFNFGADSTFGGAKTSGSANASDSNSVGNFFYTPPASFLALSSSNLPISDDIDPAQTDDDCPSKLMSTSNWLGSGSSNSITGLGFQPDLTIIKAADAASSDWALFDSTRGVQKLLEPNTTANEETNSNSLTAFGADGFTVGSDSRVNDSGRLMTAQSWRCNAGTTSTNSEGNQDCTLQANAKAGFSIMTLANYTSASGCTLGHGLDTAPSFYMHKPLGNSKPWHVYHSGIGATKAMILNTTAAEATAIGYFANTEPTADVLSLGNTFAGTGNGIVYAWAEVEGYSSFSKYTGNGNADGPFVYTGHMPRCVWIKRTDSSAEWAVYFWNDTSVNSSYVSLKQNPLDSRLTFDAGSMNNGEPVDFLSNGFKIRDSDAIVNASSGNYLYCSWGSVPFKYNNTF